MSLHRETVSGEMWELLEEMMGDSSFQRFFLVGGTSLAFRLGHRRSIDLDFFTEHAFEAPALARQMHDSFDARELQVSTNSVGAICRGIKVDCIAHRYPTLEPVETMDGIRMASLADVAAMKCNAVSNRGSKKDFWDLHALLSRYSVTELLDLTSRKYAGDSRWALEKSLIYFEDAESDPDPDDLQGVTWPQVKADLLRAVQERPPGT